MILTILPESHTLAGTLAHAQGMRTSEKLNAVRSVRRAESADLLLCAALCPVSQFVLCYK